MILAQDLSRPGFGIGPGAGRMDALVFDFGQPSHLARFQFELLKLSHNRLNQIVVKYPLSRIVAHPVHHLFGEEVAIFNAFLRFQNEMGDSQGLCEDFPGLFISVP